MSDNQWIAQELTKLDSVIDKTESIYQIFFSAGIICLIASILLTI